MDNLMLGHTEEYSRAPTYLQETGKRGREEK